MRLQLPSNPVWHLASILEATRQNPILFNDAVLQRSAYWLAQEQICQSVVKYRTTVCYSGNMIGKDYLVGGLLPWWVSTRRDSLAIVTGPSQTLLGSVTWKEIRRAVLGSAILRAFKPKLSAGARTSPHLFELAPGWHALGFSTTSVERASGQHSSQLLVIVEEASGVGQEIADAVESLGYQRLLLIGNPIRAEGWFVDLVRQADKDREDRIPPHLAVNAIQIPSTDSPHATWEKSPWGLADKTWLDACYRRYGKDSLWCRSHIQALIPSLSSDALIPETWLDWATVQKRPVYPSDHPIHRTRRIAVDLGEGVGRDSSAIIVRDDVGLLEVRVGASIGLREAAEIVLSLATKWEVPQEKISYDRVGIGRDFSLMLTARGLSQCVGYAGSARGRNPNDFVNLRSEAAWNLRQRLDPQHIPGGHSPHAHRTAFSIPPGPYWSRLREELAALTYDLVGRQTRLIPKKDLLLKLGHSPDLADALIQSFAF